MSKYTKAELLNLYNMDLDDLLNESKKFLKDEVEFCSIISARTGKCSQNCKYCAQSSHYNTDIETNPLLDVEAVLHAAKDSIKNGADRVAIVTSGKTPDESDFDTMLDMIKALNRAGIEQIRFHDLRHTYASLLLVNGAPMKYVQHQLGHSSITMTMDLYTHVR